MLVKLDILWCLDFSRSLQLKNDNVHDNDKDLGAGQARFNGVENNLQFVTDRILVDKPTPSMNHKF